MKETGLRYSGPALIFVLGAAITLGLWNAQAAHERTAAERVVLSKTQTLERLIEKSLGSRILALVRMEKRWEARRAPSKEEWESDARLYLSHYAGYGSIEWIDPSLHTQWFVGKKINEISPQAAEKLGNAFKAAELRRGTTLSEPVKSVDGVVFMAVIPIASGKKSGGFIAVSIRSKELFDEIFKDELSNYSVSLSAGAEKLYEQSSAGKRYTDDFSREVTVDSYGVAWRLRVTPEAAYLTSLKSVIPAVTLLAGIILSLALASGYYILTSGYRRKIRILSRTVEQSPVSIVLTDVNGTIEYVNPRFTEVTGYTPEEAIGKNPRMLKSGEQGCEFYKNLWATITSGREWHGEFHNRKKDGELYWERAVLAPIKNSRGVVTHFVALKEDITELKAAEEALAKRTAELEKSNRDLEQFAYVASHDLQEPLRIVSGYLQLLSRRYEGKLDSTAREFIHYAVDASKRMQTLISDLLSYSRLGGGGEKTPVDTGKIVDEAVKDLGAVISERGAMVSRDALPTVEGDESQLKELFQNLIGNAVKYSTEAPRVSITAIGNENEWLFSVSDNGIGIDQKYFDRIFKIFQRLHGRDEYSGTGIGLAICQKVVENHNGRIWVESGPGKGSTFYFTIPKGGAAKTHE